ncbi:MULTISPECIES: GNAT family N-acetyltransferase [Streptomyces]|uniref:GNAT family N-acetyltransferase n=1 Tax=Streptomyces koelreuteriae TaxID=2838015 RepID=A0ABX8FVA5_9ACTN|nr:MULTISPECIES: GNAT family protein [Streptomyces]QWB24942.1 GNAT family N-acetyltransferase [Streptomyces koelreuteriae]UUA07963.1 GNAT family N-acetyltransferase [Streptomyces koelreuteriae]UUA15591.1 GNAT family N-acetyltransferase [Streptomyces sp. CRCS-T-1]
MASLRDPSSAAHPELHGHGLRLRPWDATSGADVETWLRGMRDPEFRRWNTPLRPVTDLTSARDSLLARGQSAMEGTSMSFRVADARGDTPLGHIGVNEIKYHLKVARVGYWVLPEARGQGVATRALLLAARWAFDGLGLHRLELDHAVGHDVSCRIAERCGFAYEGTLRGAIFQEDRHDAFRDAHLHARLATDPEPGEGPAHGA